MNEHSYFKIRDAIKQSYEFNGLQIFGTLIFYFENLKKWKTYQLFDIQ